MGGGAGVATDDEFVRTAIGTGTGVLGLAFEAGVGVGMGVAGFTSSAAYNFNLYISQGLCKNAYVATSKDHNCKYYVFDHFCLVFNFSHHNKNTNVTQRLLCFRIAVFVWWRKKKKLDVQPKYLRGVF